MKIASYWWNYPHYCLVRIVCKTIRSYPTKKLRVLDSWEEKIFSYDTYPMNLFIQVDALTQISMAMFWYVLWSTETDLSVDVKSWKAAALVPNLAKKPSAFSIYAQSGFPPPTKAKISTPTFKYPLIWGSTKACRRICPCKLKDTRCKASSFCYSEKSKEPWLLWP